MSQTKRFTNAAGIPVADNTNIMTAGRRGPAARGRYSSDLVILLPDNLSADLGGDGLTSP
jgi:hypothetical protein